MNWDAIETEERRERLVLRYLVVIYEGSSDIEPL